MSLKSLMLNVLSSKKFTAHSSAIEGKNGIRMNVKVTAEVKYFKSIKGRNKRKVKKPPHEFKELNSDS